VTDDFDFTNIVCHLSSPFFIRLRALARMRIQPSSSLPRASQSDSGSKVNFAGSDSSGRTICMEPEYAIRSKLHYRLGHTHFGVLNRVAPSSVVSPKSF
jgi:hypothetical protein